jgi:hypothetical protein
MKEKNSFKRQQKKTFLKMKNSQVSSSSKKWLMAMVFFSQTEEGEN